MNSKSSDQPSSRDATHETIAADGGIDTSVEGDFTMEVVPKSLGRYEIEGLLGRGGMGAVYLAHDAQLNRKVALKIPKFSSGMEQKTIARFYREARSAATLSHPNLCPVFDVGEIDETHYIAMAYIQGRSLDSYISPEKPAVQRVAAILIRKVALALEEAHRSGIIHRDIKPSNIMIDHRKEPIVMDFGLACPQEDDTDSRLTQEGALLGSPAYMSPEQVRGQQELIGNRSDIYSLGVVLYELLTGYLPFHDAGSTIAMIGRILTDQPPEIRSLRTDVHAKLAEICNKAMAKDPDDRFQSMQQFADALTGYVRSQSGEGGTLGEPRQMTHAEITRIQLLEQSRLAKTFCDSGQYDAAVPILKHIVSNPHGQESDIVKWAKATLPDAQSKANATTKQIASQPEPVVSAAVSPVPKAAPAAPSQQNLFADLPEAPAPGATVNPLHPSTRPTPARRSRREQAVIRKRVITLFVSAVLAIAIGAGGFVLVMVVTSQSNPSENTRSQSAEPLPDPRDRDEDEHDEFDEDEFDEDEFDEWEMEDDQRPGRPDEDAFGPRPLRDRPQNRELAFETFDRNDDGFVDEFEVPEHEIQRFMEADRRGNNDGKVSLQELLDLPPPPKRGAPFNRPGGNGRFNP